MKIFVAQNEQKPYTEEELGYPTYPMPTKAESGYNQTGDYYAEIDGEIVRVLIERKSLPDAYGSFVIEKNRARLYSEIDRYHEDDRFDEFIIVVEATPAMFKAYFPWAVIKWHQKKGDAQRFCGMINKKKDTVLAHLNERGGSVEFAGSRQGAADAVVQEFKDEIWAAEIRAQLYTGRSDEV